MYKRQYEYWWYVTAGGARKTYDQYVVCQNARLQHSVFSSISPVIPLTGAFVDAFAGKNITTALRIPSRPRAYPSCCRCLVLNRLTEPCTAASIEPSKVSPGLPLEGMEGGRPAEESTTLSAISGFVAGAAVSTSKQLLLYPVDTVKVGDRRQHNRIKYKYQVV